MNLNKPAIKATIHSYLQSHGWPNMPNPDDFVMAHLKFMFLVLLERGLVQKTHWKPFYLAAQKKYLEAKHGV